MSEIPWKVVETTKGKKNFDPDVVDVLLMVINDKGASYRILCSKKNKTKLLFAV